MLKNLILNNKSGFTLMETLACITIVAVMGVVTSGFVRLLYQSNLVHQESSTSYVVDTSNDNEMFYNYLNDTNKIKEYTATFRVGQNKNIFLYSAGGSMYLFYQGNIYVNGTEYPFVYQKYEYFKNNLIITLTYESNTYYLVIYGTKL